MPLSSRKKSVDFLHFSSLYGFELFRMRKDIALPQFKAHSAAERPMRTLNHTFFGGHRKRVLTLAYQHHLCLSVFAFELPIPCLYLKNIDLLTIPQCFLIVGYFTGEPFTYQHSLAPAGMASLIWIRFSFSSPFSVWTALSSMPQDSRPIIFRGGRLVMASRVLPTSSSGL